MELFGIDPLRVGSLGARQFNRYQEIVEMKKRQDQLISDFQNNLAVMLTHCSPIYYETNNDQS